MRTATAATRYDSVAMTLHWAIALLIVVDFLLALSFSQYNPGDTLYFDSAYALHMSTGACVLLLSLGRLAWRLTHARPPLPDMGFALNSLARLSHFLLYLFMIAVPLSGWFVLSLRRQLTSVFGLFSWAWPLPGSAALSHPQRQFYHDLLLPLHTRLSYLGMSLVALHVAAALYHQLWRRDDVLRRMLPRLSAAAGRAVPSARQGMP